MTYKVTFDDGKFIIGTWEQINEKGWYFYTNSRIKGW